MTDDLISRQAAIDAINQICPIDTEYDCTLLDRVDVRCVLETLPSAQPEIEPKTGRWIDYYGEVEIYNAGGFTETRKIGVKCSVCQWINRWYAGNYCGNCGVKMKGETE